MIVTLFNRLLSPHPAELSRDVWFQEEARAERLANLIRIAYWSIWLMNTAPAAGIHPFYANVANIGVGIVSLLWSGAYHAYLRNRPYTPALKYLSTTIDVVGTTAILFLYHYDMGYSTSLKAPPFMNYILTLALAAFRFNVSLAIYGGVLAILAYVSLLIYMITTQGVQLGSPLELFTTPKINLVYQVYRVNYLVALAILLTALIQNAYRLIGQRAEETERRLAEKARREQSQQLLERYFTPEIARYLADHPPEMGGTLQPVTVLMSDVRNFTTLSEKLGPVESVRVLNLLFDTLVSTVFNYQGTLDKFLGDGMLVIFGVPAPQPDDALRAVLAAQEMVEKVHTLGGNVPLEIGIAIHSGDVIFGNVGSPRRMELTAIGDAVNCASRMEALNKEFGTNIIISETTYREVQERVVARPLPARPLRGKSEEIKLYALEEVSTIT